MPAICGANFQVGRDSTRELNDAPETLVNAARLHASNRARCGRTWNRFGWAAGDGYSNENSAASAHDGEPVSLGPSVRYHTISMIVQVLARARPIRFASPTTALSGQQQD
jgi:hypothetical protein